MKYLIAPLITLFIVFSCSAPAKEVDKDPDVMKYIEGHPIYVPMADESRIEKLLGDETAAILEFMDEKGMNVNDYYLYDKHFTVSADGKYLMIPLIHYNSIAEEAAGKEFNGNPSGKDGHLIVDPTTKEVVDFQLFQ